MAKGVYYTKHLDLTQTKGIYEQPVENWNFLYATPSTTKSTVFDVGDKVVLPDGREFRYALSNGSNALYAAHGCEFTATGLISYQAFAVAASVGDMEITVPAQAHTGVAKDALRGGYVVIFDGASDYYTCVRGICGNEATTTGVAFKVQLDAPLAYAITAGTSAVEVYQNPWASIGLAGTAAMPKAGLPTTYVGAAANYFWVQTKGICWIAPQGTVTGNEGTACMWRHDGSLEAVATALGGLTAGANDSTQYAGYCMEGNYTGNGPLFNMVDHG